MESVIQQKVIEVATHVEQQLDAELDKLDNLDINDYEKIRAHRLNELKRMQKQKQDWLASVNTPAYLKKPLEYLRATHKRNEKIYVYAHTCI